MAKQNAVKIFSLKNLTNRPNVMIILLVRIIKTTFIKLLIHMK